MSTIQVQDRRAAIGRGRDLARRRPGAQRPVRSIGPRRRRRLRRRADRAAYEAMQGRALKAPRNRQHDRAARGQHTGAAVYGYIVTDRALSRPRG